MQQLRILPALVALTALGATLWLVAQWLPRDSENSDAPEAEIVSAESVIGLTEAKQRVAGIESITVKKSTLMLTRTVPGRFAYDDRHHVAVRTPADGVIDGVFAKPGNQVTKGQHLAVLRSSAIGNARSEVLQRQDELALLDANRGQLEQLSRGVSQLVTDLQAGQDPNAIHQKLQKSTLGQYRGQLLSNYSKFRLATQMSDAASNAGGAISGRVVQQRVSEQQQARAELEGAIELAKFQSQQDLRSAVADVQAAQRKLYIARQQLATLLGLSEDNPLAQQISANESALSRFEITAPIEGTVERRDFSATERVAAGDELFIVADTSRLWIEADIRGRDWRAINIAEGQTVLVTTPALPDQTLQASVHFVGREVDPATGAISLVAELDNPDGIIRPGLFARVELPVGSLSDVIAVPSAAIVDVQGTPTVFVETGDGYRPTAVETGSSTDRMIEIRSGLEPGQRVVTKGAFLLKSELLLEGEE